MGSRLTLVRVRIELDFRALSWCRKMGQCGESPTNLVSGIVKVRIKEDRVFPRPMDIWILILLKG